MAWQHRWAGGPFFLLTNGRGVGPAAGATGAWSAPRLPSATPHCDSACGCAQFLVSEMRAHKNALTPSFDAGQEACSQSPRIRLLELLYSVLVWFFHCCALPCHPSNPARIRRLLWHVDLIHTGHVYDRRRRQPTQGPLPRKALPRRPFPATSDTRCRRTERFDAGAIDRDHT